MPKAGYKWSAARRRQAKQRAALRKLGVTPKSHDEALIKFRAHTINDEAGVVSIPLDTALSTIENLPHKIAKLEAAIDDLKHFLGFSH